MFHRKFAVVALWFMFFTMVAGCDASDQNGPKQYTSPFLESLSYVPDNDIYHQWVAFGDLSAWYDVWKIARPETGDLRKLESPNFNSPSTISVILDRQTNVPNSFNIEYSIIEDQVALLGFNYLTMDRYLEAGVPPHTVTVAEFSFDKVRIADALTKTGYQSDNVAGGVLYHIRGDNELDNKSPARTLLTPDLNRILLSDGRIVIGSSTEIVKKAQDANSGTLMSLAKNEIYVAMAQAIEGDSLNGLGKMVGVILINGSSINNIVNRGIQNAPDSQVHNYDQNPLPDFDLAGFATFQKDKTTFLALVLVFPQNADAQSAAEILSTRLQKYTSDVIKDSYSNWWSVEKATGSIINNLPVAVVVMRAEDVEVKNPTMGNSLKVLTWDPLIQRQDILFLKTGP